MPPRKEKLSKDGAGLKELMGNFSIKFEGPVPARDWPPLYSHHFHAIRDISRARYDDYLERTDIPAQHKARQKKRVSTLRENAYSLRQDLNINESTWRDRVEPSVVRMFEEQVICPLCGDEQFIPDHMAIPCDADRKEVLESKRRSRKKCECNEQGKSLIDHDDEMQQVFKTVTDKTISHSETNEHDTYLKRCDVPMKPDRVIGLNITDGMRHVLKRSPWKLEHMPIKGSEMVYPFLVVEAKNAQRAPGFRSIERQIAFPIRRLLHVQDELRGKSSERWYELPLVWFFAYQGEEWRLYAAVLPRITISGSGKAERKEDISIYDLWHGTVESEDGAFQLVQIIDFIWSWARDIFRPQIKACLIGDVQRMHPQSLPIGRVGSYPTFSNIPYRTDTPDSIMTDIIETVEQSNPKALNNTTPDQSPIHNEGSWNNSPSRTLSPAPNPFHPFFKWATAHNSSNLLSKFSTIRHANIILYTFQIRTISNIQHFLHEASSEHHLGCRIKLLHLLKSALSLQFTDLYKLASLWTSKTLTAPIPNHRVTVSLIYHTYCRRSDWQIVRQMQCIIWPRDCIQQDLTDYDQHVFHRLQNLHRVQLEPLQRSLTWLRSAPGKYSLYSALRDYYLLPFVCDQAVEWEPGTFSDTQPHIMKICFELLDDDLLFANGSTWEEGVGTVWGGGSLRGEEGVLLQSVLGEVPDWRRSVVTVRPDWWPSDCPKFCLFVLLENGYDDCEVLVGLLRDELLRRRFYGGDWCSEFEKMRLTEWLTWLEASNL